MVHTVPCILRFVMGGFGALMNLWRALIAEIRPGNMITEITQSPLTLFLFADLAMPSAGRPMFIFSQTDVSNSTVSPLPLRLLPLGRSGLSHPARLIGGAGIFLG